MVFLKGVRLGHTAFATVIFFALASLLFSRFSFIFAALAFYEGREWGMR
jgi:hypothetical protein